MRRRSLLAVAALILALRLAPARAHHSFAQFDMTRNITLTGTVRDFQWTNPHTWVWLIVSDSKGTRIWGLEGGAVGEMERQGWTREIIKRGEKITVEIHPLLDGRMGGSIDKVILPDGRVLTRPGPGSKPAANAAGAGTERSNA